MRLLGTDSFDVMQDTTVRERVMVRTVLVNGLG